MGSPLLLTNGDEADFFVFFVTRHSLGAGIQNLASVDVEKIPMMPVTQRDLRMPPPVGKTAHGMRVGSPVIEITDDADALRLGVDEHEIGGAIRSFRRVTVFAPEGIFL